MNALDALSGAERVRTMLDAVGSSAGFPCRPLSQNLPLFEQKSLFQMC